MKYYDKDGFDKKGINKSGYDRNGYKRKFFLFEIKNNYNAKGYDRNGLDRGGFNKEGYNSSGYNKYGVNKNGLFSSGLPWWSSNPSNAELIGSKKEVYLLNKIKASSLFNNPFYILGIDLKSTNREITKRSSDIIKLTEIGHVPDFPGDLISVVKDMRSTKTVKDAVLSLSDESLRAVNTFLWFQFEEKQLSKFIKDKTPYLVFYEMNKRRHKSESEKHNIAIYSLIIGIALNNEYLVNDSIDQLNNIINKSGYLEKFKLDFQNSSELKISDQVFNNFEKNVLNKLSDIYFEFANENKKLGIYHKFFNLFNVHSVKFQKEIIIPNIEKIKALRDNILKEEIKIVQESLTEQSKKTIEKWKKDFNAQINILVRFKINKDTNVISIVDETAEKFSQIAVDILNKINRTKDLMGYNYAKKLLDYALSRAHSVRIKDDIKKNIKFLADSEKKNAEFEAAAINIKRYSDNGNFEKVTELGKKLMDKAESSAEYDMFRKFVINQAINSLYKMLSRSLKSGRFNEATDIINLLLDFDDVSSYDKSQLRELKTKIMYRRYNY